MKPSTSLLLNNPCQPCIWSPSIRPTVTSSEDSVSESEISHRKQEKIKERIKTRSQSQITARESSIKAGSKNQSSPVSALTRKVEKKSKTQDVSDSDEEQRIDNETDTEEEMADNSLLPKRARR